jgi:hypothetical protein
MKVPIKYSDAEAKALIASKLKDKRKLEDQYSEYAKGGMVSKAKLTPKQTKKVGKVMGEFKDKTLHSGKGGKVVKDSKQAIAIALSEASRAKKK